MIFVLQIDVLVRYGVNGVSLNSTLPLPLYNLCIIFRKGTIFKTIWY